MSREFENIIDIDESAEPGLMIKASVKNHKLVTIYMHDSLSIFNVPCG